MKVFIKIYIILVGLLARNIIVAAQEQISIPRLEGEIKFDGKVDEPAWQKIKPLPMVMNSPTFGNNPTEKSEVFICYDNTYLYVGARLYDSNPGDMLISSKQRDEMMVRSEELMLIIDSFNDKENAL
jgi:hypothetical protein